MQVGGEARTVKRHSERYSWGTRYSDRRSAVAKYTHVPNRDFTQTSCLQQGKFGSPLSIGSQVVHHSVPAYEDVAFLRFLIEAGLHGMAADIGEGGSASTCHTSF